MNAILQALFALVPFSTDLLNVTDTLDADSSLSSANNQRSVVLMLMTTTTTTTTTTMKNQLVSFSALTLLVWSYEL